MSTGDLGIPYAFAEWDDDLRCSVRICPECGERIPEPTDANGEPTANTYAKHYAATHE